MAELYCCTEIYDLLENEARYDAVRRHWQTVLADKSVRTLLDVSIGTGNLTLPLADLGVELHGSDLSPEMLKKCRAKAASRGIDLPLQVCDFRALTGSFGQKFDCVASTGNSLPHVGNGDVMKALREMDALVADGGWLYFDLRNWDKILRDRDRFYLYNPVYDGDTRINLVQVWDYNADGSMTFNLLYTFEREGQIFRQETFDVHYHPIGREVLLDRLKELGYRDIQLLCHPAYRREIDPRDADWYCVVARK